MNGDRRLSSYLGGGHNPNNSLRVGRLRPKLLTAAAAAGTIVGGYTVYQHVRPKLHSDRCGPRSAASTHLSQLLS